MSPLGLLNFVVMQWFGVRLYFGWAKPPVTGSAQTTPHGRWWSPHAPPRGVGVVWGHDRWIWPLTGWWSRYRWIYPVRRR